MSPSGSHPDAPRNRVPEGEPPGEVVDGQVVPPERRRSDHRRLDFGFHQNRYASQLPSPDDLERYAQLLPDAPERLLASGEREQAHRHLIENRLASIDETAMPKFYAGQRRGHFISLALGLGYEGIMAIAVLKGYAVAGIFGAAAGIAAMIWAVRRDTDSGDQSAPPPTPEDLEADEDEDALDRRDAS